MAQKMDYHLSLCYPIDIAPIAAYRNTMLWSGLERVVGQDRHWALGCECVVDISVTTMAGHSFQELFVQSPLKLCGFGLQSLADTSLAALIGATQMSLSAFLQQR
jgi:hypothetical protein